MFNIASKVLSTCASLGGTLMLLRFIPRELIPEQLRSDLFSFSHYLFTLASSNLTFVIDESSEMSSNEIYRAAHLYLATNTNLKKRRLRISKTEGQKNFAFSIEKDEVIVDIFRGIQLKWRYNCIEPREQYSAEKKSFELSFNRKFYDRVVDCYLPYVLARAKQIKEGCGPIKIYTRACPRSDHDTSFWRSMILAHPATFDTVAMEPDLKKMIIDDLERFVSREKFYKKVGKARKRGYLLSGPPGTGKSTLIAAMANYLKFDIYDLELASIYSNSDLRKALLSTTNRSILVIEDIDCSIQVQDRENRLEYDNSNRRLTLSGILNFIDGLWSSCGDEKIIVLTTNHKDRLDPALLRPGRMDLHINLSYCTVDAFRILASNYLGISNRDHPLFGEIESLIQSTEVTPAEVAEQLMRIESIDLALQGLVNFLKHKRSKCEKIEEEVAEIEEANSLKRDNEEKDISVRRKRRRGIRDSNTKTARRRMDQGLTE
ncbi:hypothetical protein SLEP1_g49095 [Rubroshorea leprosula]|uniref:AAA+ ATPase domain-containing protein n=1 Tax=Rubroshorea leprosula TaxID=152421 RepID=A0AAV5LXR2_9ROSI|nr:hypothetical protein SLEP1_g49095 [Rubroshorea leprosula]